MDEDVVFEKTERGQREIAQPGGELLPRLRRILIMVDGKRSLGEIAPMTRPGEIEPIVDALLRGGFIVASGGESGPQVPGGSALAVFAEMRGRAARAVEDALGPNGIPLAIEIERASTPEQLGTLLARAQELVGKALGPARAEEFRKKTAA